MYCGGTIIGSKVVLTAAHCICQCVASIGGECVQFAREPNCNRWRKTYVIAGDHDNLEYDEGEQKLGIHVAIVHANWTGNKII